MSIAERLKDIDIGISELSKYLNLSRPTLYKFIDLYDNNKKTKINRDLKKLFDYIKKNEFIGRNNVINFIFKNIVSINEINDGPVDINNNDLIAFIKNNPHSEVLNFVREVIFNDKIKNLSKSFYEIVKILNKKNKSQNEKNLINLFYSLINEFNVYKGVKNDEKNS